MKISDIQKLKGGSSSFCTVTAYDYPTAKIIDDINIPLVLVGDSASMVVYGYNDTTQITMDEMILIAKAVRKTFNDSGTLFPNKERTPKEKAISVAEGIAQPFKVAGSPRFI